MSVSGEPQMACQCSTARLLYASSGSRKGDLISAENKSYQAGHSSQLSWEAVGNGEVSTRVVFAA